MSTDPGGLASAQSVISLVSRSTWIVTTHCPTGVRVLPIERTHPSGMLAETRREVSGSSAARLSRAPRRW